MKKLILLSAMIFGFALFFSSCEKEKVDIIPNKNGNHRFSEPLPQIDENSLEEAIFKPQLESSNLKSNSNWTFWQNKNHNASINFDYTNIRLYENWLELYDFRFVVTSDNAGFLDFYSYPNYQLVDFVSTGNSAKEIIITQQNLPLNETDILLYTYSYNNNNYNIECYYRPKIWSQIQSGNGVKLYKKTVGSTNHYVQEINLKTGATLKLKEGSTISASTSNPSPTLYTRDMSWYWNNRPSNTFSSTNCQFFNYSEWPDGAIFNLGETQLSFPVKESGTIKSCGYANYDGNSKKKFGINGDQAWIDDYTNISNSTCPLDSYCYVNSNLLSPLAFVGLHPLNVDKGLNTKTGRTMVGVRDKDGDYENETIYIYTSSNATQYEAYNILKNEFLSFDVLMLDGSGSSQLNCNGTNYVDNSRNIPSVMYAIEG